MLTNASFDARYRMSRPAMDDAAAVLAGRRSPPSISRNSLYHVAAVERIPSGVRFIVKGTGSLDRADFAYSAHGTSTQVGEDSYTHLDGPWYVWSEGW